MWILGCNHFSFLSSFSPDLLSSWRRGIYFEVAFVFFSYVGFVFVLCLFVCLFFLVDNSVLVLQSFRCRGMKSKEPKSWFNSCDAVSVIVI